jgi:hypothetical protein
LIVAQIVSEVVYKGLLKHLFLLSLPVAQVLEKFDEVVGDVE